ncbi:hypothetical protein LXL04_033871 [Taraxacum kok-saghyz]
MGDMASNRPTFRTKFELEKRHHSHSDIRSKVSKSQQKMESSSSPSPSMETMKHLPTFLENGKQDRPLSFGVMDWNRLQKWQDHHHHHHHHHHHKPEFVKSKKYNSPSSTNSSSVFSTDGSLSSPQSSQSQNWSPASQKVNRLKIRGSTERPESPSNRAHTSPLRRLLDPIFPSKTSHEDSRTKAKVKLDFKSEIRVDNVLPSSSSSSSSTNKQALFQTTVKNGRLLFAVENNDILAATLTTLASGKNDNGNSFFTFLLSVRLEKRMVLNSSNTREFVLFSVKSSVQPQEELEAIVVKFSRNQERFSTTVVLHGGSHGVPIKGEPSSLTDRWRSGGVCDCGGWDEGCRLKTFTNRNNGAQLELFVQGEIGEKRQTGNNIEENPRYSDKSPI